MGIVDVFLPTVLHGLPEAVVATDDDGVIRVWNAGATLLFGDDEAGALGRRLDDVLGPAVCQGRVRTTAGSDIAVDVDVVACGADDGSLRQVLIVRLPTIAQPTVKTTTATTTTTTTTTSALQRFELEAALPPRLRETLQLLVSGLSEKQLADRMSLSPHTVHDYVKALYRRVGVQSRAELVARVVQTALTDARGARTDPQ